MRLLALCLLVLLSESLIVLEVKSACYQGFLTLQDIPAERENAIIDLHDNVKTADFLYPDLRFLCDGNITAIYFGAFFSSNRDAYWGKVLQATVSIWRAAGVNYRIVGRYVIRHDLEARSNRQGLVRSSAYPDDAYFLLSNSVLRIRETVSIPVRTGDIFGLSLLPDTNPWEDAIPVIALQGSASSYVLHEDPDTSCWNADAEGFIPCHEVAGTYQPAVVIGFQQNLVVTPSNVPTTTFSPVVECFTSDISCSSVQPNSIDAPTDVAMLQAENHGALIAAGVLGAILLIALVAIVIVCVLFVGNCASLKKTKGTYNTSDQSVVMTSNLAYITTEVDESRDYATLHTVGNTEDSCQSKPVVGMGQGYNHLQRESVKSSITSGGDGHLSYSNIDCSAQYLNPTSPDTSTLPAEQNQNQGYSFVLIPEEEQSEAVGESDVKEQ